MSRKAFTANLTVPSGIVRDEVRNGVQFLVVPVVMLQEQVLFCSNCNPEGEFISAAEIATAQLAWDNRPITLSHPTEPWSPTNHQRLEVGRVFNVRFDGKLRGEMWLDTAKLKSSEEGRVAEMRFRKGEVTEVSTGYFADRINQRGTHNGTKYVVQQTGIIPDHLAILVNEIGACSIQGGCGAPRLNTQSQEVDMDDEKKLLARIADFLMGRKNDDADEEIQNSDDGSDADGAGPVENDGGDTSDSATDGSDADGIENQDGSDQMDRKDLVAKILNSGKAVGFDEAGLLAMSDDQFSTLATLAGCGCGGADNADEGSSDNGTVDNSGADDSADEVINFTAEDAQFVASLRKLSGGTVEGLSSLIEAGQAEAVRRTELKASLVASLVANAKVAMGEATLKSMTLEALEGFDRSLNPTSYAGRGGARIIENTEDDGFAADAPSVFNLEAEA